jgi:hypothetical protein
MGRKHLLCWVPHETLTTITVIEISFINPVILSVVHHRLNPLESAYNRAVCWEAISVYGCFGLKIKQYILPKECVYVFSMIAIIISVNNVNRLVFSCSCNVFFSVR